MSHHRGNDMITDNPDDKKKAVKVAPAPPNEQPDEPKKYISYTPELRSLVYAMESMSHRERCAAIERYTTSQQVRTDSDLAWCLGKLRGLGHPAVQIEERLNKRMEQLRND